MGASELRAPRARRRQNWATPYLFIAPALLVLTIFWLGPVVVSIILSFTAWGGFGTPVFVGLDNFAKMLDDSALVAGASNTLWYAAAAIAVVAPLGLLLALALNDPNVPGRVTLRSVFFVPGIAATAAVSISFLLLLDTRVGLVNYVLGRAGVGPVPWLSSPNWSKTSVLVFFAWAAVGFVMIYFIAGLQAVPADVLDAARVDGASRWATLLFVTLPQLRPTVAFVVVIITINTLQIFVEPFILTDGGPNNSSTSASLVLFESGVRLARLGYASAIGLVIFAVTIVVSLVQLRLLGVFADDQD